jgi:fructose-1,6-bisphosphatase/inositol monophosphatase family enzyme
MIADPRDEVSVERRKELLAAALELADLCRDTIASVVASGFEITRKADDSLVTTADVETEKVFRAEVKARFPAVGIVGEELGGSDPDADYQWIIDPIDGTAEFARHLPVYGNIIGLHYRKHPLVGVIDHPALGLRCHAAHGLGAFANGERLAMGADAPAETGPGARLGMPSHASFLKDVDASTVYKAVIDAYPNFRVYHTCYTHTLTTMGALDAAMEWDTPVWDLAATRILVEEAGGRYVALQERESASGVRLYSALFGQGALVEKLEPLIRGHM